MKQNEPPGGGTPPPDTPDRSDPNDLTSQLGPVGPDDPDGPNDHATTPAPAPMQLGDVTALIDLVRAVAHGTADRETVSDAALEDLAISVESARRALDAAGATINGEMHARNSTDRRHGHSAKSWTAATLQLPSQEAARRIKQAKLLRQCPVLAEALISGRVNSHHVGAIANATNDRNVHIVIDIQQHLIDMTDEYTLFAAWAAQVLDLLRLADPDGAEPQQSDNGLHMNPQYDGSSKLDATLVGDTRDVVEHALEVFSNRIFRRLWADQQQLPNDLALPDHSTVRALALAEICRTALSESHTGSGTAADVTYVIHSDDPETVRTHDGERVARHTAHVALCDGVFHPIVLDRFGAPLDVGRAHRFATPDQRRAARVRDGGCVFDGCSAPQSHCDLHHVDHWQHGGNTDMANLASLCRHHHGVVHRDGWAMSASDHGWFDITSPSGQMLTSQRHGRPKPTAA